MAEDIQEEPKVLGPGAQLKARREALNLTVEDIADKLHLRPAVVEDLEKDLFDHTVSMTFTKGYVRLYAKHLDLPPEPLLELFEQLTNPIKQPAKLKSFSQKVARQASDARLMMVTWFIILVMVGLAGVWWWQLPEDSSVLIGSSQQAEETQAQAISNSSEPTAQEPVLTEGTDIAELASENVGTIVEETSDYVVEEIPDAVADTPLDSNLEVTSALGENDEIQNMEQEAAFSDSEDIVSATDISAEAQSVTEGLPNESTDFRLEEVSEQIFNNDIDQNSTEIEGTDIETPEIAAPEIAVSDSVADEGVFPEADNSDSEDASLSISNSTESTENEIDPLRSYLVFTFSEDCWMNLTDATGEVIAVGVKTAGRVMPVDGIPPFEVVLGAPQGVQINVDGEDYDISGFSPGRTARFTIGETL